MLTVHPAFFLTGIFGLSMYQLPISSCSKADHPIEPRLINVPLLGVPASLAFGYGSPTPLIHLRVYPLSVHLHIPRFGAVYMICAVGVYV